MVHSTSDIISCFEAEQRSTVFSALSEYLSTGQYVDISLVCKGQVLRAHKVVLSSSSKYFKDFFRHQPGVNIIDLDKELAPNDLSLTLEDVQLIIGILYCVGTVEISPARIETLLICAQVLGIPTLISFLKKIRESIKDNSNMLKEPQQRLEYGDRQLPGLPLLSPHHKILAPAASVRPFPGPGSVSLPGPSGAQRRNSADMLPAYLLPGPAAVSHQFSQQPSLFSAGSSAGPAGRGLVSGPGRPLQPPASAFSSLAMTRPADTPSPSCPRSPLLDLSVVKPLTASCVSSPAPPELQSAASTTDNPAAAPSPVPGPSRSSGPPPPRPASTRSRSVSFDGSRPSVQVQDSLLSANQPKVDPESVYRRESSRISTASYSSFTLNYLQSPRLKSTENPATENQQSLDGFDQNFFISLNTLQANQIDDLENVLLPHLSMDGRSDNPLLDLNNIDEVESNQDAEHDISTTSPEDGTPNHDLSLHESQDQNHDDDHAVDDDDDSEEESENDLSKTLNSTLNKSDDEISFNRSEGARNMTVTDPDEALTIPIQPREQPSKSPQIHDDHSSINKPMETPKKDMSQESSNKGDHISLSKSQEAGDEQQQSCPLIPETESINAETMSQPCHLPTTSAVGDVSKVTTGPNPSNLIQDQVSRQEPPSKRLKTSPVELSPSEERVGLASPDQAAPIFPGSVTPGVSASTPPQPPPSAPPPPFFPRSVTPVRMTPSTSSREVVAAPIRLTPHGHIALTPIKNLMPDTEKDTSTAAASAAAAAGTAADTAAADDSVDEQDGGGGGETPEHSGEIVMNLDKVIEGQRMKFSIPGISQAVTVNFSPEALQEMKNAALNNQNQAEDEAEAEVRPRPPAPPAPPPAAPAAESPQTDNQYSEITSSDKTRESELLQSNKMSKKKNNKKNLRQKLKSNLKSPLKLSKDEENFTKPLNYICPICNKTFPSVVQLEKHQKFHVHQQNLFSCLDCNEIFEKKWLYEQHIAEQHGQQMEKFSCPECGKEFSQRNLLLAHIQSQHKESKLRCFVCNIHFNKKHNLMVHLNSWHPNEKFPYCPVCMDIFNDTKSLESHECPGAEIKNREVICHLHETPMRFTSRVELDNHMKEKHGSTEENFNISCCICQKKFLLRNNLVRHLKNVHNQGGGGNKHYCPTCGKQFYYKDDLKHHIAVHEGDLKFKCTINSCEKAYSTLKALKKHNKLTHEVDAETVTCKICNKQLSTKFKLKAHMLVHSNAKPFSCAHCSETFKEKRNVVKHMKLKHINKSTASMDMEEAAEEQNNENENQEPGESVQISNAIDIVNHDYCVEFGDEQPDSTALSE